MIHHDRAVSLEECTDIAKGVMKFLCALGLSLVNLLHSIVHISHIVRHKLQKVNGQAVCNHWPCTLCMPCMSLNNQD